MTVHKFVFHDKASYNHACILLGDESVGLVHAGMAWDSDRVWYVVNLIVWQA